MLGYFEVIDKNSYKFIFKVRGETISTHQPYRADEKWETTFSCGSNQFVEIKFDTMDFSQIALDIIKINLLTADLSKFTCFLIKLLAHKTGVLG